MPIKKLIKISKAYLSSADLITTLKRLRRQDTAYLIATGPSLKKHNLALLAGRDCFTISNAYLHNDIISINPILHTFAGYHPPLIRENIIEWFGDACKKLPQSTEILTTRANQDNFGLTIKSYDRTWHFIDTIRTAKISWPHFGGAVLIPPQAGPLLVLPVLLQLGYKNIFLIGCDQNQIKNFRETISNFYHEAEDVRVNATDRGVWPSFEEELLANLNMIRQYSFYNNWAKKNGVKIYNVSDESWLDMFQFCSFEGAINFTEF